MDITKIAKKYVDHGFKPIPLRPDSKVPAIKGWQKNNRRTRHRFQTICPHQFDWFGYGVRWHSMFGY